MHLLLADWTSWEGLIGVIVGGCITLGSTVFFTFVVEQMKLNSTRKQIAATLTAELTAISAYISETKMIEALSFAAAGSKPNVQKIPVLRGSFLGGYPLGFLPGPLARETAELITLIRGTIEDFTTLWHASSWQPGDYSDFCTALGQRVSKCKADADSLTPKLTEESRLDRNLFNQSELQSY